MTSWKTSLGGALAALGTFLWGAPVALRELGFTEVLDPSITKWCILIGLAASAGGVFFIGLFGRDNNVSSEDVQRARAEKEEKKAVNDWLGGKGAVWLAIVGLFGATLLFTPGCAVFTGKSPVTYEATRYQSFRDVWTVTRKAYEAHLLQVARGKVSIEDQQDINAAWNAYRSAYLIALDAARNNEQAFTPENVRKLADDLLTLISAL